jgi:hypothetical protein
LVSKWADESVVKPLAGIVIVDEVTFAVGFRC